jgi:hypothetical protein
VHGATLDCAGTHHLPYQLNQYGGRQGYQYKLFFSQVGTLSSGSTSKESSEAIEATQLRHLIRKDYLVSSLNAHNRPKQYPSE